LTENGPVAHPCLPSGWERVQFRVQYHGQSFEFDLKQERVAVQI
jgi:kojibiose phosphorylase